MASLLELSQCGVGGEGAREVLGGLLIEAANGVQAAKGVQEK